LIVGGGVAAAGSSLAAFAPGPAVALTGFAVTGLGYSVIPPTLFGLAGRSAADGARTTAISTLLTLSLIG
jgi:hypothetical protein